MKENSLKIKKNAGKCPRCGSGRIKIHEHYFRLIRDLDADGNVVEREFDGVRFQCMNCKKTFTPSLIDGSSMTNKLLERIADKLSGLQTSPSELAHDLNLPVNTLRRNISAYYKKEDQQAAVAPPKSLYLYHFQNMILYIDLDSEMIIEASPEDSLIVSLAEQAVFLFASDSILKDNPVLANKLTAHEPGSKIKFEEVNARIRSTLDIPEERKLRLGKDIQFIRYRILYGGNRRKPQYSKITGGLVNGSGRLLV